MTLRAASIYALLYATEVTWLAMIPLAPRFAEELALSPVETGAVLAAAGVATLAVSLPVGLLADRLGPRTLTIASGALLVLSEVGQGVASDYPALLAARVAFGIGMGGVWTAGLAFLSTSRAGASRTLALGGTITTAAAASVTGPVCAGFLGDRFGLGTPFLVLAAATAVATVVLVLAAGEDARWSEERRPLREVAAAGFRNVHVLAAVVLMTLLGVVNGGVNLLVPLELRGNGLTSGEIGAAFSVSSAVFLAGTLVATRLAGRSTALRIAGVAAAVYGALIIIPITSATTAALVAFVVVRAPAWAVVSTFPYPLGAIGAERAGIGHGAVVGFLNLAWGASNALGPLLAGAVAGGAGARAAFLPAIAVCTATAGWLLVTSRAVRPRLEAATRPGRP